MKIAQVAPLWEQVPPEGYGGIELVMAHLTDELVRRGHDVTLFASGDSQTLAKLEAVVPKAVRHDDTITEPGVYEILQLERVLELAEAEEFDLVHFHISFKALPWADRLKIPAVHTLHNGFTEHNLKLYHRYRKQNYISISNEQTKLAPQLNYIRTVYNGIDTEDYPFYPRATNPPYLAFLGRMSPQKGPEKAIAIAKQAGMKLKMAGKIGSRNHEFFRKEIEPHLDGERIEFIGEVGHEDKVELLGNAAVTLFPIAWEEPFGLVPVESMCTGTPAIGMNRGAVPETIAQGKTGFVCNNIEEAIAAVPAALELDRQTCRDRVVSEFSIAQMVNGYEDAYEKAIAAWMSSHNGHKKANVSDREPSLIWR